MAVRHRFEWPSEAEIAENGRRARIQLEAEVAAFEREFGIPSERVHAAIDDGTLEETGDVCRWLIAIDSLEHLRGGG